MRCALLALWVAGAVALLARLGPAFADELPEYRLKAAFLYNFVAYTEWPADSPGTLNVCVYGSDPFGAELDSLQGKVAAGRTLAVQRKTSAESLRACQVVFVPAASADALPRALLAVRGQPVLVVAESPGALRQGAALNMALRQNKVTFEANLQAARAAGLSLSSKLLRLATEVQQ